METCGQMGGLQKLEMVIRTSTKARQYYPMIWWCAWENLFLMTDLLPQSREVCTLYRLMSSCSKKSSTANIHIYNCVKILEREISHSPPSVMCNKMQIIWELSKTFTRLFRPKQPAVELSMWGVMALLKHRTIEACWSWTYNLLIRRPEP